MFVMKSTPVPGDIDLQDFLHNYVSSVQMCDHKIKNWGCYTPLILVPVESYYKNSFRP